MVVSVANLQRMFFRSRLRITISRLRLRSRLDRFVRCGLAGNAQQRAPWEFSQSAPAACVLSLRCLEYRGPLERFTSPSRPTIGFNSKVQAEPWASSGVVQTGRRVSCRCETPTHWLRLKRSKAKAIDQKKSLLISLLPNGGVTRARTEGRRRRPPRQLRGTLHCLTCSICTPRRFTSAVSLSNKERLSPADLRGKQMLLATVTRNRARKNLRTRRHLQPIKLESATQTHRENISNWSPTKNFVVPQSGVRRCRAAHPFASTHRFSWHSFADCSRCVSILQNKASRAPIDRESGGPGIGRMRWR